MQTTTNKVKIIEVKPHIVKVQFVDSGQVSTFPRKSFERKLDLGIFEVINPEMMPVGL